MVGIYFLPGLLRKLLDVSLLYIALSLLYIGSTNSLCIKDWQRMITWQRWSTGPGPRQTVTVAGQSGASGWSSPSSSPSAWSSTRWWWSAGAWPTTRSAMPESRSSTQFPRWQRWSISRYYWFFVLEPIWFQSQPQLILQLTMLLNEWEQDERHVSQAVSLGVHAAILTYHIAGKLYWMWHQNFYSNALLEHYFFEASGKGKKKLFSYKLVMRIVPFSLFNFTGELVNRRTIAQHTQ